MAEQNEVFKEYGWICPVCGRGLSPSTSECPCYKKSAKIVYDGRVNYYKPIACSNCPHWSEKYGCNLPVNTTCTNLVWAVSNKVEENDEKAQM